MFGVDPLKVIDSDRYDTLIRLACYRVAAEDERRRYEKG